MTHEPPGLRFLRRRAGLWLPVVLGVLAFVVVDALMSWRGTKERRPSPALDQTVDVHVMSAVAVQVAVHDAIETAASPVRVGVCRSLADRRVTIAAPGELPLARLLDEIARQAGSRVVVDARGGSGALAAAIVCPDDRRGDYVVIGLVAPPPPRR